jgi:hypothetical protein
MKVAAQTGSLDVRIDEIGLSAVVESSSGRSSVRLSPAQAREWARVLLKQAQEVDGEPMRLSIQPGFGPISVRL